MTSTSYCAGSPATAMRCDMPSKLLYVPQPEPNRPHVTRAIWWATMDRCRESGGAECPSDGGHLRRFLGLCVFVVIFLVAVISTVGVLTSP